VGHLPQLQEDDGVRKTTATLLDEAGLSARVIADQLGHASSSLTQDVYMGRKIVDGRAVEALEETFGRVCRSPPVGRGKGSFA